ncbi:hypothetical protein AS850_06335 [Frondihabitans sp. 762G35]|uniref:hypothetical protein n=1 Tax=Frondihabitans sp. 762G35 TaxID=1446794 RepID=UPI000D216A43|nr:hypothetical protein [Frondihabitans sp. 762G35]ARC56691.1 hypothetical protein AS850_06335 [Frondihabitans sp. 762G35]
MPSPLLRTSDLVLADLDDSALRSAARRGEMHRIVRGAYLPAADWAALSARGRYAEVVRARAERLGPRLVLSHDSAAVLWGYPTLDPWPPEVHARHRGRSTGKRTATLVVHPAPPSLESVDVDGFPCTTAARTSVDLALAGGFARGVLAFDHALRAGIATRQECRDLLARQPRARNGRNARVALDLATPASESPGESISRAALHEAGFEAPELQRTFAWGNGRAYRVDFWWPSVGVVGEFDGEVKYLDEALRRGLSAERVVLEEKRREDALRAHPEVRGLVRWDYATARSPQRLAAVLRAAGVPRRR